MRNFAAKKMAIQVTYRRTSRLSMRIVKNGDVHVSAPFGMPRDKVLAFIEEHKDWINQARKKTYEKQEQEKMVEPMMEKHAKEMGVKPSIVYYKPTISRWGQCNVKDRSICISAYVLLLPEWCVEHVVVHELCHLLEPSHNARFHALMDKYFPRWREARKETHRICRLDMVAKSLIIILISFLNQIPPVLQ